MTDENGSLAVDWEELAHRVGSIREDGSEGSSTELARRAIEILLGPDLCRSAVDYYVSGNPGSELARSILWHIHPWSAMERCHEIYNSSADTQLRCRAVELLRVVADERALGWVEDFLEDTDEGIQTWGAGIVDQLLWSDLIDPEDCEAILTKMRNHPNDRVRETHGFIRSYLESREEA